MHHTYTRAYVCRNAHTHTGSHIFVNNGCLYRDSAGPIKPQVCSSQQKSASSYLAEAQARSHIISSAPNATRQRGRRRRPTHAVVYIPTNRASNIAQLINFPVFLRWMCVFSLGSRWLRCQSRTRLCHTPHTCVCACVCPKLKLARATQHTHTHTHACIYARIASNRISLGHNTEIQVETFCVFFLVICMCCSQETLDPESKPHPGRRRETSVKCDAHTTTIPYIYNLSLVRRTLPGIYEATTTPHTTQIQILPAPMRVIRSASSRSPREFMWNLFVAAIYIIGYLCYELSSIV